MFKHNSCLLYNCNVDKSSVHVMNVFVFHNSFAVHDETDPVTFYSYHKGYRTRNTGHVLLGKYNKTECLHACLGQALTGCLSINHHYEDSLCELHNQTTFTLDSVTLLQTAGWEYYEVLRYGKLVRLK